MSAAVDDQDPRIAREAVDWFARLRGEAAPDDRAAFERWRSSDARHREAYELVATRWEQAAFLRNSGLAKTRDLSRAVRSRVRPGRLIAGLTAAAAVVALALFAVPGDRPGTPARAVAYANTSSEARELVLADGSQVRLDSGAALEAQVTAHARRLVLQRGRARFTVVHDAARPFVVTADGGSVTALGTVFEVAHENGAVRVTLFEGSVNVRAGAGRERGDVRRLRPGQQTVYRQGEPPAEPSAADTGRADRMFSFDNTRLDDAAAAVSRGAPSKITVDGPAATLRISGAFRAGDPDAFAKAAAAVFELELVREGRSIRLRKKP